MRLQVTSVRHDALGIEVEFSCHHGAGQGRWTVGIPKVGQEYDVEVECRYPLRFGINTWVAKEQAPRICSSDGQILMIVKLEECLGGCLASLRFGESVFLFEYEGSLPSPGTWVEMSLPGMDLFDTGI